MDDLLEIVSKFETSDLSAETCQMYLESPADMTDIVIAIPKIDIGLINETMKVVSAISSIPIDQLDKSVSVNVKRIGASALSIVNNSADMNAVAAATRLLLNLCSLPGATAYGILNTNLLATIANTLYKISVDEVTAPKNSSSTTSAAGAKRGKGKRGRKENEDEEDEVDEDDTEEECNFEIEPSQSQSQSQSQSSQPNEQDAENNLFGAAAVGSSGSGRAKRQGVKVRITPSSLSMLVRDFKSRVHLFWQRSEEHPLECCAEALAAVAFLTVIRSEFSISSNDVTTALVALGTASEKSMMAIYRALMPALTMAARDSRIPDNTKSKTQAHKISIAVLLQLAASADKVSTAWTADEDNNNLGDESTTPSRKNDSKSQANRQMDLPYACIIGAIQRMTVSVPDRAPTRAIVLSSIVDILTVLQEGEEENDQNDDKKSEVGRGAHAVNHYLLFLAKLSRCNKVSHRAYCLEIATAVIAKDWVWSLAIAATTLTQDSPMKTSTTPATTPAPTPCKKMQISPKEGDEEEDDTAMVGSPTESTAVKSAKKEGKVKPSFMGPKALLELLVSRCDDSAPSVRVRAIGAVSDLLASLHESSPAAMAEYLLQLALGVEMVTHNSEDKADTIRVTVNLLEVLRARTMDDKPMVRAKAVQAYGIALCKQWPKHIFNSDDDEENMSTIEMVSMHISEEDVNVFIDGCNDVSVAVRKQSIAMLTDLVNARPTDNMIQEAWVVAALPLASDSESSVQARLAQCAFDLLIEPAIAWEKAMFSTSKIQKSRSQSQSQSQSQGTDSSTPTTHFSVWAVCVSIVMSGRLKLLRSAIGGMISQNLLTTATSGSSANGCSIKTFMKAIKTACCFSYTYTTSTSAVTHIPSQHPDVVSKGAWVLLEALLDQPSHSQSSGMSKVLQEGDFVVQCFREKRTRVSSSSTPSAITFLDDEDIRMLRVCEKVCSSLSDSDIEYMTKELKKLLMSMQCDAAATAAAVSTMFALSKARSDQSADEIPTDAYAHVQGWTGPLLSLSHSIVHAYVWRTEPEQDIFQSSQAAAIPRSISQSIIRGELNTLTTALFCIGEIAMLGFSVEDDDTHISQTVPCTNGPTYTLSAAAKTFKLSMPDQIVTLIQLLMGNNLPSAEEVIGSQGEEVECPDVVRAHAFVTMGKLCLRDLNRSRSLVNIFLRELRSFSPATASGSKEGASNAAVRSNALLVLGDMCVRFTSVVDRHVGAMASCLQDPAVMVRRHALVLLTQLLLQDFLKWRGMLLFRFLAMPADSDQELASFARTILKTTLQSKFPDLFVQHLSEAVLVFNSAIDHPVYVTAAANGSEGGSCTVTMEGVDLEGPNRRSRRLKLYAVMMEGLNEEQKISVASKIVQDILSHALDCLHASTGTNRNGFSPEFSEALEDALLILQSPLLKIGRKGSDGASGVEGDDEEEGIEGEASNAAAMAKAKTKVLAKISRQHLVGHVLPIVMSLKAALEAVRSPLQGAVMEYLVALVKGNKAEVDQVLQNDPCLKSEIEYDLKMFDKAKQDKVVAETVAAAIEDTNIMAAMPSSHSKRTSRGGNGKRTSFSGIDSVSTKEKGMGILGSPMLKSSLVRSLANSHSRTRTPREALRLCVNDAGDENLADRLLGGNSPEEQAGGSDDEGDMRVIAAHNHNSSSRSGGNEDARDHRRRSWSVVVGLGSTKEMAEAEAEDDENSPTVANEGIDDKDDEDADYFSPEKKRGKGGKGGKAPANSKAIPSKASEVEAGKRSKRATKGDSLAAV